MLWSDARVALHLLLGQRSAGSHAQRLQMFYGPQARHYDRFRERLLQGRRELIDALPLTPDFHIVELGGGTGRNLEYIEQRLGRTPHMDIVDLCPALLALARDRARGREGVRIVEGDATTYRPEAAVDCVIFSYALTMIPDWFLAIDNALSMLKPGGYLGVVDFFVSREHPEPGCVRHGRLTRMLWPLWFAHDGVHLSSDHPAYLGARCVEARRLERKAHVPLLPGAKVPYYLFVGRKPLLDGTP